MYKCFLTIDRFFLLFNVHLNKKCIILLAPSGFQCDLSELLRVLAQPSPSEVELFSGLRHEIFTSNLVNMEGAARNGPYTAFMTNVLGKVDHGVLVDVDMAGLLTPGMRSPEVLARYNNGTGLQTKSCQQIGKETRGRAELRQMLKEHYKGFHAQNLDILHTRSWNYFPR